MTVNECDQQTDGISAQKKTTNFFWHQSIDFAQYQNKRNALIRCMNSYFLKGIVTASNRTFKIFDGINMARS